MAHGESRVLAFGVSTMGPKKCQNGTSEFGGGTLRRGVQPVWEREKGKGTNPKLGNFPPMF